MDTAQKFFIDKSEIGFRRYIKLQKGIVERAIINFETFDMHIGPDWDKYCDLLKVQDLDNKFIALLNDSEREAIKYMHYHNPNESQPYNYHLSKTTAYKKWVSIFFKEYDLTFCEINQIKLGRLMKTIRLSHNVKIAELARAFDVDISCISLYESGQRLPNLNYIKKFAYLFSVSIDDLVSNSLEDTLHSTLTCNIQNK